MNKLSLLVFPAVIDGSEEYLRIAKDLGIYTIAASSVPIEHDIEFADEFIYLPFITDSCFYEEFINIVYSKKITHIYAPHQGVWLFLRKLQKIPNVPNFKLCSTHKYEENWIKFQKNLVWAEKISNNQFLSSIDKPLFPKLSLVQYAALSRRFLRIPGECDLDKLEALCAIARILPSGDIIEIGSLFGRSAYALARLAQHYKIGSTISIDPWRKSEIEDQGPAANILRTSQNRNDPEKIFMNFQAEATDITGLSYIRETSVNAVSFYKEAISQKTLNASGLDAVPVCGRVALLHIDGNHRYDHVMQDISNWASFVVPGGWILIDDYIWAFGNGPKIAGDELIMKQNCEFDLSFVAGDTLFIRKSIF